MLNPALRTLAEAARLAPSGDNTQPWKIEINEEQSCVTMHLDPSRDQSPMNAGQTMARIALGTALENMVQVAAYNSWEHEMGNTENSISCRLLANYPNGDIPDVIVNRATNRKKYQPMELSESHLEQLRSAMKPDEEQVIWITQPEDRRTLCQLIGEADSIMLSIEQARLAFLEKVRFDQPVRAVVEEGLSLGSLEISPFQRMGLRMMPFIPDAVIRRCGGPTMFRQAALRLADSAAGFCVVTSASSGPQRDFQVGRLFQRAWLATTRHKLEAQPMMSLLVLKNMITHPAADLIVQVDRDKAATLIRAFEDFTSHRLQNVGTAGALLRFGQCERPSTRTARLGGLL